MSGPDWSAAEHEMQQAAYWLGAEMARPSYIWRPRLFLDGNQWCALLGENIMIGVAGFGDSPEAACCAFDTAWRTKAAGA